MNVALRAAADRFIYDVAALRTIGDSLEDAEFHAICPAVGRSVLSTFGLLVSHYRAAALALKNLRGFAPGSPFELPTIEPTDTASPDEIDKALAAVVCELLDALNALPSSNVTPSVTAAVSAWSSVGAHHALDFLEAVPELAQDPLLLSWAVFPVSGEPAGLHDRRIAVLKQARDARKKQR
ncbi:MAG: hypothetical protein AB7T37_08545 [Dehalococcoidia bacterium]